MTAPAPDSAAAVKFLRAQRPAGPWAISTKIPDGPFSTHAFSDVEALGLFIAEHNGHRNLYFAVNPAMAAINKKAEKTDIARVDFLHVDIDARAGEPLEAELDRIVKMARGRPPEGVPPPTFIVFTGGGCQLIWQLAEPIQINGDLSAAQEAERYNLELARVYGGDNCHNIDRVLRLPGSVNLPDGRKLKRGRVPALAKLLNEYDRGRIYSISKFRKAASTPSGGEHPGASSVPDGEGSVSAMPLPVSDLAELDAWGVPDRVKLIIQDGHVEHQPKPGDNSRSAWLFDAVCNLTRRGVPDPVILGIITDRRWRISESVLSFGAKADQYARRQIAKAGAQIGSEPPILHKEEPLRSAREFRVRHRPTLMHYNSDFLAYDGAAYRDLEDATVRSELYKFLDRALTPGRKGEPPLPFNPTKVKVGNVLDALMGVAHIPRDIFAPPCWLEGDGPPPGELLACRNGLLHLPTEKLLPPTPRLFTRNALDFDFDPAAPPPERWLRFLGEAWGEGDEIGVLQEIMGYLLVPDTSQQKIFLLVGPRRSGKGTIGRVLRSLVGDHNTSGPTLGSLARDFGLAALVGKQLAVVSDMRLGKMTDRAAITENLLRISGEDVITADRKYKSAWTGQLGVRFLILTNELPNLPDDSGALASRLVPVMMDRSFLGREDPGLLKALLAELPGILRWAIAGWRRLHDRGHFVLPEASRDTIDEVHILGSPVAAFLRERCVLDGTSTTPKEEVWQAWRSWCEGRGMYIGDQRHFGAKLITAGQGRVAATKPRSGGARVPSYAALRLVADDEKPKQEDIPF